MNTPEDTLERLRAANPAPGSQEPDWELIVEHLRRGSPTDPEPPLRPGRPVRRRRRRILAAVALCVALATVALAALAALAPGGGGGQSFLARAAAALTPPGPGSVLYERWEHTITPEPGNPVLKNAVTIGPDQLWIEGGSPHAYRAILVPGSARAESSSGGAMLAATYGVVLGFAGGYRLPHGENELLNRVQQKLSDQPFEIGGTIEAPQGQTRPGTVLPTLTYLGAGELLRARLSVTLGATLPGPHDEAIEDGADPVSALRTAIAEGRAHDVGSRTLDGRTVERVTLSSATALPADAPPLPADAPPQGQGVAYADVETGTFDPVQIVFGRDTYRFLAYEYLPADAANLALTDIRAQHPHATVSDAVARPPGQR